MQANHSTSTTLGLQISLPSSFGISSHNYNFVKFIFCCSKWRINYYYYYYYLCVQINRDGVEPAHEATDWIGFNPGFSLGITPA